MVGRSATDISDLRRYIYQSAKHRGKYAAEVEYRGLPYHTVYVISYGECATDKPFCVRQPSSLKSAIFHSEVDMAYNKPHGNTQFPMVAQKPYNMNIYLYTVKNFHPLIGVKFTPNF